MYRFRRVVVVPLVLTFLGAGDPLASGRPAPAGSGERGSPLVVLPQPAMPAVRLPAVVPPVVPKSAAGPAVARRLPQPRPPRVAPAPFTAAVAVERGAAAFASLHRSLPAGWRLRFAVYRGRNVGLADGGRKVLTLWVKRTDSRQDLRITLAHELGHVLDYTRLDAAGRATYLDLRGRRGTRASWYPCDACEDFNSPAGDFAEVYAYWLAGAGDFRSRFAPVPDAAQLPKLARFFTDLEQRPA